ncbi:MAG: bifunctional fucokinase/L-fucose-1-P-guanylyltransferase [Bacteroidaceae bacterium]|nr:bifunctional fucokinase/L-fucose-1-P-guanylyltransferase [Bacteroidaceae bacterium]
MKHLLSLPPNVVPHFHKLTGLSSDDWFCTADPVGHKLGSGGGTAWLLGEAYAAAQSDTDFFTWLRSEQRLLLHAGGQSRRLPCYAPSGKALTPMPVFRWESGQTIDQTLLDTQLPLYHTILEQAPQNLNTLIASGDVFLRSTQPLPPIPEDVDVVCYGLWADADIASHHGVFLIPRNGSGELDFMLQKPSIEEQRRYVGSHYLLMDVGLWLLSPRAVELLMQKCVKPDGRPNVDSDLLTYDLYSEFGGALGNHPSQPDALLSSLKVCILPLQGGEFYHFGTAPELLSSAMALQNIVRDQRLIIQQHVKAHPSLFTQNALVHQSFSAANQYIWVENACVGAKWQLSHHNIITGVPQNDWAITLSPEICIDIVPIGDTAYALRPYGYYDTFRGGTESLFLGKPFGWWLSERGLTTSQIAGSEDLQSAQLFPVLNDINELPRWFDYITQGGSAEDTAAYLTLPRLSAEELSERANLPRLFAQRQAYSKAILPELARNWRKSIFYQTNLADMAQHFVTHGLTAPSSLPEDAPLMMRIHAEMFRSEIARLRGDATATEASAHAFELLAEGLTAEARRTKVTPRLSVYPDQIVWGRSPVRIDVAGGWTDTPPYSLTHGGAVINLAIELGGQQPLQVYVKPCKEPVIVCRSIDLSASERLTTYEELAQFNRVGSPFSIPKAALALCGFLPGFGTERYTSLRQQLEAFGAGIEITLLAAIPAGSGLGTSSILAATVLGALSDFCDLRWDAAEVCRRVLVLEQLLTTGGGWQDQFGGVLPGVKLLQTEQGFNQTPVTRWLPDTLFTAPEFQSCHLLYYTGITRTAKHILAEIVRGMFLNSTTHLRLLSEMKAHTMNMYDALQRANFELYGKLLRRTWVQNQALDAGTNPPQVARICNEIDDLCSGYKLPGAGGGGYLYMVAKDAEAAQRIRQRLSENPPAAGARFVDMHISQTGLQVSRS